MNAVGRLYMQLSYSWLNSFFRKRNQWSTIVQSIYSPKVKGLLYKRVDKDKINETGSCTFNYVIRGSTVVLVQSVEHNP